MGMRFAVVFGRNYENKKIAKIYVIPSVVSSNKFDKEKVIKIRTMMDIISKKLGEYIDSEEESNTSPIVITELIRLLFDELDILGTSYAFTDLVRTVYPFLETELDVEFIEFTSDFGLEKLKEEYKDYEFRSAGA